MALHRRSLADLEAGSHIRYRPNAVFVNSTQGVRDIYLSPSQLLKSKSYQAMAHLQPNTLTTRDPRAHYHKRKRLAAALSDEALRKYEPIIVKECDTLCTLLEQQDRVFDLSHLLDYLSFDIMMQIVFGTSFRTLTDPKYRYVIDALQRSHVRIGILAYLPIVGWLRLDRVFLLDSLLAAKTFLTFMYQLLRSTLKSPSVPPADIMSYLMIQSPSLGEEPPSRRELYAEAPLLIVGASDTTATTLAALFFHLSRRPDVRTKVVNEVRTTFSDPSEVRMQAALGSCAYLRACIDEALRLCPPVPGPLVREVPSSGMLVDKLFMVGATEVACSPYSVHRNPEVFPDPHSFVPQRWIVDQADTSSMESVQSARRAFMPFSVGARSCVGKKLGIIEVTMIAARVLLDFDFEATDIAKDRTKPPEFEIADHLNAMKSGPLLRFRKRAQPDTASKSGKDRE